MNELMTLALDSKDFLGIADAAMIDAMKNMALSSSSDISESQFLLRPAAKTAQQYSTADPIIQALEKTHTNGQVIETLGLAVENTGIMYTIDFTSADESVHATRYSFDAKAGNLEFVDASAGGVRLEPVPDGVATHGKDPCGGCASATKLQLGPRCKTSKPVQCVLTGAGCGACIASCSAINASCILCVVSSCGSALVSCCEKTGDGACFPCGARP